MTRERISLADLPRLPDDVVGIVAVVLRENGQCSVSSAGLTGLESLGALVFANDAARKPKSSSVVLPGGFPPVG